MRVRSLPFVFAFAIVIVATATYLTGCVTGSQLTSRLDSSGLTIVTLDDPVILALPERQMAAAAQDFAYIGPVELNRMGHRDYFLWIGLASTIDRELFNASPAEAQVIAVLIDGWPETLPLVDWAADLDESPYESDAPLYRSVAAHASLDLIRRISTAETVEVNFVSASGVSRRYQKWQGDWSSWSLLAATE